MRKITLVLLLTSISFILLTPRLTHAEYNPITGRFLQRDPIKYVDGMNLYEYVNSRPTYFVDSFGLTSVAPVILESELGAYGHYIAGEGKPAALAPWLLDILANQGGFFEMKLKILSEMSTLFPKCDRKPRMKVHTIVKIRKGLLTGPSYSIIEDEKVKKIKQKNYNFTLNTIVGTVERASIKATCVSYYYNNPKERPDCSCISRVSCTLRCKMSDTYRFRNSNVGNEVIDLLTQVPAIWYKFFKGDWDRLQQPIPLGTNYQISNEWECDVFHLKKYIRKE